MAGVVWRAEGKGHGGVGRGLLSVLSRRSGDTTAPSRQSHVTNGMCVVLGIRDSSHYRGSIHIEKSVKKKEVVKKMPCWLVFETLLSNTVGKPKLANITKKKKIYWVFILYNIISEQTFSQEGLNPIDFIN